MIVKLRSKHRYMIWFSLVVTGFLISMVQTSVNPVPDTAGTSFLFTLPFCEANESYSMYVVPQTTEAVNLTLVSHHVKYEMVQGANAMRHTLVCEESWNYTSNSGFRLLTTQEVTLYVEYAETAYMVYPLDTLSTQYTVITFFTSVFDSTFFTISGNYTLLAIDLPSTLTNSVKINGTFHAPGATLNVYLGDDETLTVWCLCDLTGIKILSSFPVSVLSGSRNSSNFNLTVLQQLQPKSSWGRKFMFNKHSWVSDHVKLKIVGKRSQTSISVVLKDETINLQMTENLTLSMHLIVSEFIAIESDNSVSCSVLLEVYDVSHQAHFTMLTLTPVLLYSFTSSFLSMDSSDMSMDFVLSLESIPHVSFNISSDLQPFSRPMTYYWNYFLCRNVEIEYPFSVQIRQSNTAPMYAVAYLRNASSVRIYPLGMRVTNIYDACIPIPATDGGNGDGIDNDCDNRIDEEILNGRDDDNDGLIDEDIVYSGFIQLSQKQHIDMAWEYYQRKKAENQQTGIATSVVSILISISVGLSGVGCFIGFMFLVDKLKRKWESNTRIGPIS